VDQSLLFRTSLGEEQPAQKLSEALHEGFFASLSDHFIGARVYRQFFEAVAKAVTKMDLLEDDFGVFGGGGGGAGASSAAAAAATSAVQTTEGVIVDWGRVMELQSGHSPATASAAYAGDASFSIYSVNNATVFLYRRASQRWHAGMALHSTHGAEGLRHPFEPLRSVPTGAVRPGGSAAAAATAAAAGRVT